MIIIWILISRLTAVFLNLILVVNGNLIVSDNTRTKISPSSVKGKQAYSHSREVDMLALHLQCSLLHLILSLMVPR